ncbi:MAG: PHP-associated domain-containing protein [Aggregatilineales bacterium]
MTTPSGRADIHIHTRASDGLYTVREMLDAVATVGTLDVIAITDHDRVDSALWAYERNDEYTFDIIPGTEVTNKDGHILGLWVTEKIPNGMPYKDTVDAIHAQGGLAIFAHPFHIEIPDVRNGLLKRGYWRNYEQLIEAGFDAIEGFNAASVIPGINVLAQYFVKRTGLSVTGGSDAHTTGSVNCGITHFPGKSADDLRQAILNGTTRVSGHKWHPQEIYKYLRNKQWNTSDNFHPEPENDPNEHKQAEVVG